MNADVRKILDRGFAIRFAGIGLIMVLANFVPYVFTYGSYGTDGRELAGFPLSFYEFGGPSPIAVFNIWALAGNIVIAFLVALAGAYMSRNGFRTMLRRWQTWGTPFAS